MAWLYRFGMWDPTHLTWGWSRILTAWDLEPGLTAFGTSCFASPRRGFRPPSLDRAASPTSMQLVAILVKMVKFSTLSHALVATASHSGKVLMARESDSVLIDNIHAHRSVRTPRALALFAFSCRTVESVEWRRLANAKNVTNFCARRFLGTRQHHVSIYSTVLEFLRREKGFDCPVRLQYTLHIAFKIPFGWEHCTRSALSVPVVRILPPI